MKRSLVLVVLIVLSGAAVAQQVGPGPVPNPGVEDFTATQPLEAGQVEPDSLAGKIRVEDTYAANTTIELARNSTTNYTLLITIPNATNVTFYLQQQAVAASQNISNVQAYVNGTEVAFGTTEASGGQWITFEVAEFSTKQVSFVTAVTGDDFGLPVLPIAIGAIGVVLLGAVGYVYFTQSDVEYVR